MTVEFTNKGNRTWLSNLFLDPGFLPVKDIQSESILMCYKVPPDVWDLLFKTSDFLLIFIPKTSAITPNPKRQTGQKETLFQKWKHRYQSKTLSTVQWIHGPEI